MIAQYGYTYAPFADAPYAATLNAYGNPATLSKWPRAPYFKLPPSDIALLESDPELRQRWMDYVVHLFLPPLRRLVEIILTQVRAQCSQRDRWLLLVASIVARLLTPNKTVHFVA